LSYSPLRTARLLALELRSVGARAGRTFDEGTEGAGSLRYHGRVPVLTLRGTPREMGFQHGRLLRGAIEKLRRDYLHRFLETVVTLPDPDWALERSARLERHLPEHHREEVRGLAEGAGIAFDEAVLLQTFLDLHKLVFCSTIVTRSPSGRLLFGRNLDFPSLGVAHRFGLVTLHRGEGKRPLASVSWPGLTGVISGMNDVGLTVAVMVVYFEEDVPEGIPYALHYRRILEEAETVGGAGLILYDSKRTNSNNLMVVDGTGAAGLFETTPAGVERRRPEGGALFATNHFLGGLRRPVRLHPISLSSHARCRRLGDRAKKAGGRMRLGEVIRALRSVAPPIVNLQAMVFLPEEREILLSMGSVPAARGWFERLPRSLLFPH